MTFARTPELLHAVRSNPKLEAALKANPVAALEKVTQQDALPDSWLHRLVIVTFALTMFVAARNHKPHEARSTNRHSNWDECAGHTAEGAD